MGSFMRMTVRDSISAGLTAQVVGMAVKGRVAMGEGARELEAYAKTNAPWEDQTGDARNLLNASVDVGAGTITINLAHGVDYGYWLELIQNGEYAILLPSIEAMGPGILERAGAVVLGVAE